MHPVNLTKGSAFNQFFMQRGQKSLVDSVKKLCTRNFLVFQKVELGMEISNHHKEWWELIKPQEDAIILSPRDHGKSMSLARGFPIWKAKYDPWIREIYILGADRDSAVENLDKIKTLMQSRPSLRYLVPDNRTDGINSRSEVHLMNGVVLRAKGVLSPLRGRHPQIIVLDDILNEKNSGNQETRERIIKYFFEVVYPMKDKGTETMRQRGYRPQIVVIGTPQHRDDLYARLLKNQSFRGLKQKAIISEEKKEVLWPGRYPYDDLIKLRETLGPLVFSKEYQCEPMSEETSLFPPSLFEPIKDRNLSYLKFYDGSNPTFLGADFSVPGSCDGDWTVFFVIEVDLEHNLITPLHYWRARPDVIQDQLKQLEFLCDAFKISSGYLESNMFQRIYIEHFRRRSFLPLKGHTVTSHGKNSFETGLLSFRPLIENGRIRLPYKNPQDQLMTDHLVHEFNGVVQKKGRISNENYHDDTVMAFWHALRASKDTVSFSYEMIS